MIFVPAKMNRVRTAEAIVAAQREVGSSYVERFSYVVSQINKAADSGKYSVIFSNSIHPELICDRMKKALLESEYSICVQVIDTIVYW